jgi:hypothetical protein
MAVLRHYGEPASAAATFKQARKQELAPMGAGYCPKKSIVTKHTIRWERTHASVVGVEDKTAVAFLRKNLVAIKVFASS